MTAFCVILADLEHTQASDEGVKKAYLEYLAQYRSALAETQVCCCECHVMSCEVKGIEGARLP